MKARHVTFIILLIIIADQALKIWIKTNFHLNESHQVIGSGFQLYFVENPGMAYGWKFGGEWGKMALTIFRMIAVIFGTWYLRKIIMEKQHRGFIFCASLVYAGALGNLIDSSIYGLIFDKGMTVSPVINDYVGYNGLATFSSKGYASFLHGNVVDMLYFPVIKGQFPSWLPLWGGDHFEFFRPIFNIADASITTGVISILVFQKRFFKQQKDNEQHPTVETNALVNDESQVS
ncbi:MAG TPA: lipoprotein signal peptidase [Ferruginibacter sp.]|nr:lipoprotein signal peptidase [Chitinophagaceae bacterium]MBK9532745.1 lipoprotein signal peptidase [Chitinophagaceae bacterium]HQW92254.1 lipoprotein signal peptidase [Ferruginibacter sp.]